MQGPLPADRDTDCREGEQTKGAQTLTHVAEGSKPASEARHRSSPHAVRAVRAPARRELCDGNPYLGRASRVAMMQPADHGKRNDLASVGGLALTVRILASHSTDEHSDLCIDPWTPASVSTLPGPIELETLRSQRITLSGFTRTRACCQPVHRRNSAPQNARSAVLSFGRLVVHFGTASCCRKARF